MPPNHPFNRDTPAWPNLHKKLATDIETIMRISILALGALVLTGCTLIPPAEVPPLPENHRQVVVLDIDGTLTPRNIDVFEPRPGAADALKAFVGKGYKIIYVTTRIPAFQSSLPDWLHRNGFPPGTLHVAQSSEERDDPANYKARVLGMYVQVGWRLAYGYGDSSSDFAAYAKAGIPKHHVFAVRRRGADGCQDGTFESCLEGWAEHLSYIQTQVPVAE